MKVIKKEYCAAILAGGNNSRFEGVNKALLKYKNSTFIQKISDKLSTIFEEIIVISNNPSELKDNTSYPIFKDKIKFCGPLSGIHSALSYSNCEKVFVVSCDMPFIREDVIKKQIQYYNLSSSKEACIPKSKDHIEPLHAIYSKKIVSKLEKFLLKSGNFKILNFIEEVEVCYWQTDKIEGIEQTFININTPEDYIKYMKQIY